ENEKRSIDFEAFLSEIKTLPKGQLWRLNQAGDLPHNGGLIDGRMCNDMVKVNRGKKGFTYTHHDLNDINNKTIIQSMNASGFTVNHSADTTEGAVKAYKTLSGIPVVTLLPMDAPNVQTV